MGDVEAGGVGAPRVWMGSRWRSRFSRWRRRRSSAPPARVFRELVPPELLVVRLGGQGNAEGELRTATLGFVRRIRGAELAAHADGIESRRLDAGHVARVLAVMGILPGRLMASGAHEAAIHNGYWVCFNGSLWNASSTWVAVAR